MAETKKSRKKLFDQCKTELLRHRTESLESLDASRESLGIEVVGDEGDMSRALEDRANAFAQRDNLDRRIREIDYALRMMDNGDYGVCEETGEEIEEKRLLAIPWTRFSREGAEIRERHARQYAGDDESAGGLGDASFGFEDDE